MVLVVVEDHKAVDLEIKVGMIHQKDFLEHQDRAVAVELEETDKAQRVVQEQLFQHLSYQHQLAPCQTHFWVLQNHHQSLDILVEVVVDTQTVGMELAVEVLVETMVQDRLLQTEGEEVEHIMVHGLLTGQKENLELLL